MREEDKTYRLIESYQKGELTGAELADFETKLKNSEELQQKVKLYKMANELVIENRLLEVKNILQEQHKTSGNNTYKYFSIVALGLIMISSAIYFFKEDKKKDLKAPAAIQTNETRPEIHSIKEPEKIPVEKSKPTEKNEKADVTDQYSITPIEETKPVEEKIAENNPLQNDEKTVPTNGNKNETNKNNVETTTSTTEKTDPCQAKKITAEIVTNATCTEEENGSILITNIKGGLAPYKLYVFDNNQELHTSHLGLGAGTYRVEIKDANGCLSVHESVKVTEKNCPKDYSFNPSMGETWNIPSSNQSGKLFIYNDQGAVSFEKELSPGAEEQWNGQSLNGEIDTGYYIFVIKYKDGSQKQGSVTIVR